MIIKKDIFGRINYVDITTEELMDISVNQMVQRGLLKVFGVIAMFVRSKKDGVKK